MNSIFSTVECLDSTIKACNVLERTFQRENFEVRSFRKEENALGRAMVRILGESSGFRKEVQDLEWLV